MGKQDGVDVFPHQYLAVAVRLGLLVKLLCDVGVELSAGLSHAHLVHDSVEFCLSDSRVVRVALSCELRRDQ